MTTTASRVPAHSSAEANLRIRREAEKRIAFFAENTDMIPERLRELDREWDIERTIEANASTLALTGVILGSTVDRRWYLLPAIVTAFLFQHAIQGWCPPVPALRNMGFRTADEINQERYALKALQGDFNPVKEAKDRLKAVLDAVGLGKKSTSHG